MCAATIRERLAYYFFRWTPGAASILINTKNFYWLNFSPKAYMYRDKNFANCASCILASCGWSSRVAMRICACAHDSMNESNVSLCKKNFAIEAMVIKLPVSLTRPHPLFDSAHFLNS